MRVTRRGFVAGAVAASAIRPSAAQGPQVLAPRTVPPLVIGSANAHKHTNGGPRTAIAEAFQRLVKGDDVLESVLAGVVLNELDPADDSVGYGGLPNAEGVVQLDACCMHGPLRRAGGVAALEGVRTPSLVARAVLHHTDHHLLAGRGAQEFARQMGFTIEPDLNTPNSRGKWLEWRRRIDPERWLDPEKRAAAAEQAREAMVRAGRLDPEHVHGTINLNALAPSGAVAGAVSTSGLAWKIPGRVGDSPILGAGLYVDNDVGAAGSTGRGEANLYGLCSFLIVESLRRGLHPKDAGMDALRRIRAATVEKRLLDRQGNPRFYVNFYIVSARGEHAGVGMYSVFGGRAREYAICTENGPEIRPLETLLGEAPKE